VTPHVEDVDGVGVVDLAGGDTFMLERGEVVVGLPLEAHELDGHLAAELEVGGLEDGAVATLADLRAQPVLVVEDVALFHRRHPAADLHAGGALDGRWSVGEPELHPREEHPRGERLDDVVVGAERERALEHLVVLVGGGHDDGQLAGGVLGPHPGEDFQAIQSRHLDVEQHQVGVAIGDALDRLPTVARLADPVALMLEPPREEHACLRIVIDHQDVLALAHGRRSAPLAVEPRGLKVLLRSCRAHTKAIGCRSRALERHTRSR
jgi:hypothetical protein